MSPRIEIVTPHNVGAACRLRIQPEQERFVAPVAVSLAEAYAYGDVAWPRLVFDGDELVGFVMAGFVDGHPLLHSTLWRLNVAAAAQGKGYGRFAVRAAAEEARRRGRTELTLGYAKGDAGPEAFYLRLGFRPTGRQLDGFFEMVAPLDVLLAVSSADGR